MPGWGAGGSPLGAVPRAAGGELTHFLPWGPGSGEQVVFVFLGFWSRVSVQEGWGPGGPGR